MATYDGKMIRGVIANYVYRAMNGKQVIQSKVVKGRMNQSEATKASSVSFGIASGLASAIKKSGNNRFYESHMFQKLSGLLQSTLRKQVDKKTDLLHLQQDTFAALSHFNYNSNSKVGERISEWPSVQLVNNRLVVTLPSLATGGQFTFPKNSLQCQLFIGVSWFRLADEFRTSYEEMQNICFTSQDKFSPAVNFEFEAPQGCLCVVNLYLEYASASKNGWEILNNKKFNPAGICAAILNEGEFTANHGPGRWKQYGVMG